MTSHIQQNSAHLMTRNLATFDNAMRVAGAPADDHERDYALVRTGDPGRPYVVEAFASQPGIVALICADPSIALRWVSAATAEVYPQWE